MHIIARSYFVAGAIATECSLIDTDPTLQKLIAVPMLSQVRQAKDLKEQAWELAEELGRALQEWSWGEQGL